MHRRDGPLDDDIGADLWHLCSGNGVTVPDMPGMNRVFVQFIDPGGVLHSETSVAVRTHSGWQQARSRDVARVD
jgi:hypothetical protein